MRRAFRLLRRAAAAESALKKAVVLPQFICQAVTAAVQHPIDDNAAEMAEHEICNPLWRRGKCLWHSYDGLCK